MKAAIFDLDGTLLNTLEDLATACNHALALEGLPTHPVDAYRYYVGNGVTKLIARVTPAHLEADKALQIRLRSHFDTYYRIHGQNLTKPYDGILALLDTLLAKRYRLAVLSNKPHEFVEALVPHYFGKRFFAVYGQRPGYPTKPDPSLIAELLDVLGVSASETIYLGDSGVDMETAKNGALCAIGVLWGFRESGELLAHGADILLSTPEQLLEHLSVESSIL